MTLDAGFPEEFARRYRAEGYWTGQTLGEILRAPARDDPDRTAIVTATQRLTYGELDARADRLAAGLSGLGLRRGDRVVVQLPNVPAFATVSVALYRLGVLPVYALPSHRTTEVSYLLRFSGARAYVVRDTHGGFDYRTLAAEVSGDAGDVGVLVDGDPGRFTALSDVEREPGPTPPGPAPSDVAFFLLSGGTTGQAKLIPRTHDDYAYQLRATAEGLGFDERGVYLASLPVAHNAALGCPGLLGGLLAGGRVVLPDSASPDEVFPLVEREGVTLTTLMPPLVHLWLETAEFFDVDLSEVILQVGGAKLAPNVARRVVPELGCRFSHWFGMAEGLLTFTRLDDPDEVVVETQGRPLSAADELRVVDEDGRDVPPGEVGELLTRGPLTLRGYHDAPEHNARAFTADGFLRTGDLVRITPEGNMVVEGRLKDLINRGGEKVSAEELEDHLLAHPAVRQAAAVAMPDDIMGEKTCAFVVAAGEPPALGDIRSFLAGRGLADYKLPDRLEVVGEFPRTNVGKVDKRALRELVAARLAGA